MAKVNGLYSSGIAHPLRGDGDGGFVLAQGDAYIEQQVLAVMLSNDSANPFQDLGSTGGAVFQNPSDPSWRRIVRERILRQFAALERNNLARLLKVEFATTSDANGDYNVTVLYVNLETNTERSVAQSVSTIDRPLRPL